MEKPSTASCQIISQPTIHLNGVISIYHVLTVVRKRACTRCCHSRSGVMAASAPLPLLPSLIVVCMYSGGSSPPASYSRQHSGLWRSMLIARCDDTADEVRVCT